MATGKVYQYLIGSARKSKYPAVMGSEWTCNMYRGVNGKQEYMESLPGLKLFQQIGGRCRGAYVSTIGLRAENSPEDMFVVMGSILYRVDAYGHKTQIGRVANNGYRVCFAEAGGPRALLLLVDGANMYYYDLLEGGELHPIQLPERINGDGGIITPSHVAVVAGSIVVNDTGSGFVYYSQPYPLNNESRSMFEMERGSDGKMHVVYEEDGVTVKTVTVDSDKHVFEDDYGVQQYFNGESSSDNVNGLYAVGPTLYVFGPKSVDVFQRGSGDYEDWIRTSYTMTNSFGLEAPNSLASIGGSVYFVASGAQYGKCVMRVTGTNFEKVSEDWLDTKLLEESTESSYGFCYSVGEHSFYCLQLNSLHETWCCDMMDGEWHQRTSRNSVTEMETQWRVGCVSYYREKFWAFTNDGSMCEFNGDYWYEDFPDGRKLPMIRQRQSAVITDGLKPFTFEEMTLECNVGTHKFYGTPGVPAQEQMPKVLLRVSRDGGMTWGNTRTAYFGRTGEYSHRVRWMNIGYTRLCVIRVTFSEPMDFVMTSCSVRAEATAEMI